MTTHTQSSDRLRWSGNPYKALPLFIAAALLLFFLTNLDSIDQSSRSGRRALSKAARKSSNTFSKLGSPYPAFPKKIWQSWKVAPLDFAERDLLVAKTWEELNPQYRYEVLTDGNDEQYLQDNFGPNGYDRPDIIKMYNELTAKIIKADLLRYLVLFVEGGVYADIDVEALRPVDRFVPNNHNQTEIDMIIGVEIDEPLLRNHTILGKKSQSFCQWTFVSKPGHPVMMRLVDGILDTINAVAAEQNVTVPHIKLTFDQVINITGPSAFTIAILEHMKKMEGHEIPWSTFHDLDESTIVGRILVLTVEAFAAGQGHSDSGHHQSRHALVNHHYHASKWPKEHPRFSHPVYGEVEKCNWNKECVAKWDKDTAAFELLSPSEQERETEDKKASSSDIGVIPVEEQLVRIGL